MAFVRYGELTADTVDSIVLPPRATTVEVLNRGTGTDDSIFFTVSKDPDVEPEVDGDDVEIVVQGSALELRAPTGSTVKLISEGTPKYSVRAG